MMDVTLHNIDSDAADVNIHNVDPKEMAKVFKRLKWREHETFKVAYVELGKVTIKLFT